MCLMDTKNEDDEPESLSPEKIPPQAKLVNCILPKYRSAKTIANQILIILVVQQSNVSARTFMTVAAQSNLCDK